MKKRILLISFLITAIGLSVFSVITAEIYNQSSHAHSETYLRAYMAAFDESRGKEGLTQAYARELSAALDGARVTFLSADGALIADSEDENEDSRADRPEVAAARETGEGFSVRHSNTIGENMAYYCRDFGDYFVRFSVRTQSMFGVFLQSVPMVLVFLVFDLLICVLLTFLATGFMLRPMEKLARDAALHGHVESDSPELSALVQLLNRMNDEAGTRIEEINAEKDLVMKAQGSKNEFISNITHEMNTPLTSIKGFAELLVNGTLTAEQAQRAAKTILTQSERLTSLVSCIINYNEIDQDDLPVYEVNASKLLGEMLESLGPAIDEHKLILLSDVGEDVMLLSRYERVTQVFGNLIRNAIRYNREGGSISVLLDREKFSVSDTGIGIAEENLGRIFDRFFTVDKSHNGINGGFGLGLAVVKKLCRKSGWELSVESKLGEGTTFTVRFSMQK